MNEQEKFLDDLANDNSDVDILEQPLVPTPEKEEAKGQTGAAAPEEGEEDDDEDGEDDEGLSTFKPKNRRERRLLRKLASERESSIFLAGKLEAREEAKKAVSEEADYLKAVERIYGTDSPEAQLATDLLKKAIVGARDDAKAQALAEYREERKRELEEQRKAESELDNILEELEDTYDITLSPAQEKAYFQLLQKMSPKDEDGSVVRLADPHAVWEVFQDRLQKRGTSDNRAKKLSARSMTQSGASKESTLSDDTHARFLRDNGII